MALCIHFIIVIQYSIVYTVEPYITIYDIFWKHMSINTNTHIYTHMLNILVILLFICTLGNISLQFYTIHQSLKIFSLYYFTYKLCKPYYSQCYFLSVLEFTWEKCRFGAVIKSPVYDKEQYNGWREARATWVNSTFPTLEVVLRPVENWCPWNQLILNQKLWGRAGVEHLGKRLACSLSIYIVAYW